MIISDTTRSSSIAPGTSMHAVAPMWKSQTNEDGKRLSQFERDALIERHCELFGTWPD